jgi:hypothetical protein
MAHSDSARNRRSEELEAFLGEVDEWAETLAVLGRAWEDQEGAALQTYAAQMRARVAQLQRARPKD